MTKKAVPPQALTQLPRSPPSAVGAVRSPLLLFRPRLRRRGERGQQHHGQEQETPRHGSLLGRRSILPNFWSRTNPFIRDFPRNLNPCGWRANTNPFFFLGGGGRRPAEERNSPLFFPFLGAEMRSGETNTWRISLPFACRARKLRFLFDSLAFGFFCEKSFFECGMAWGQRTKLLAGGARGGRNFVQYCNLKVLSQKYPFVKKIKVYFAYISSLPIFLLHRTEIFRGTQSTV